MAIETCRHFRFAAVLATLLVAQGAAAKGYSATRESSEYTSRKLVFAPLPSVAPGPMAPVIRSSFGPNMRPPQCPPCPICRETQIANYAPQAPFFDQNNMMVGASPSTDAENRFKALEDIAKSAD